MKEIENSLAAFSQYDACGQCAKRTDGLMACYYSHCDDTIKLCPDCITDSGFCYGCGHYSAGMSSFDFSRMPNYCDECVAEIEDLDNDYEDLINY